MKLTPEELEKKFYDSQKTEEEMIEEMIDYAIEKYQIKGVSREFLLDYALKNDGIDFEKENKLATELDEIFDIEFSVLEEIDIEEAIENGKGFVSLSIPDFNCDDYKLIMAISKKRHIEELGESTDINEDIIKTKAFSDFLGRKGFTSYYSRDIQPNGYILDFLQL